MKSRQSSWQIPDHAAEKQGGFLRGNQASHRAILYREFNLAYRDASIIDQAALSYAPAVLCGWIRSANGQSGPSRGGASGGRVGTLSRDVSGPEEAPEEVGESREWMLIR